MTYEDFKEHYDGGTQFFLSELDKIDEEELAYIVELMRAANHIRDIQRLLSELPPENLNDDLRELHIVERESLIILIFNISAAQLREAIKLFGRFTETTFFKKIDKKFSDEERTIIDELIGIAGGYNQRGTFMHDTLIHLRNLMFHYMQNNRPKKAKEWIKKQKEMESGSKPPYQSVNLQKHEFGPGFDYDKYLYSTYLFFGSDLPKSTMVAQRKVWNLQFKFIETVKIITKHLIIEENIPPREFGWFMKYRYGFKK